MATQINTHPQHTITPTATHSEAPASCTVKVISPAGYEYLLTMRSTKVSDVLSQAATLESWLTAHNWTPAPTRQASQGNRESHAGGSSDAPTCPTHNRPMKQGQRGWFCPEKIAPDDGTGKPVYCKQTIK